MGPTTRSYRREPQGRETPSAPSNMPASPRFATSSGWIFSQGIWFGSQDPTLRANTGTLHFLTAFPQTASSQESKSRPTTARATSGAQTRTSESTGRFSTRVLSSSHSYQSQTESPYLKWSMGTSNYIINIITLHFHSPYSYWCKQLYVLLLYQLSATFVTSNKRSVIPSASLLIT
jgi:hypothetical protein